ncbi:hypothetical protein SAMN05216466_114160 [Paraburkholderia phenazinium]|jgi:hypothetical protein|uniref:Uncharacterized protein n=1 Tax=Paraburkholderia phenazinium TaxID=60549 RepID=A0A1G8G733_9BURK|nr:hypothetical protein SAMN05216466_114160 [Paraburkholderia phenazinium]
MRRHAFRKVFEVSAAGVFLSSFISLVRYAFQEYCDAAGYPHSAH